MNLAATARTVDAALARGVLLRSRPAALLDDIERVLATGTIDDASRAPVGSGMNDLLYKVRIDDAANPGSSMWAVEKPAAAQAAQEEFGWSLARELGIDHMAPVVARRADGMARIELRPGRAVSLEGITNADQLESALRTSYAADGALGLDADDAARAARIDRQLVQVYDYLLANNDRHMSNALHDAVTGTFSLIDSGHAGRGQLATNGGTVLEPALRGFQAGVGGGRVDLDPAIVAYLRRRTTADRLRALHAATFERADIAGPPPHSIGERFLPHARSTTYRDGVIERFEHVLAEGGYTHRAYAGDAAGELPPLVGPNINARGLRNVRAAAIDMGFDRRF